MEKDVRALRGLPVICGRRRVGRVAQAALSEDLTRMDGVWVDAGLGGSRFIPSEAIEVLGDMTVTVDSPGTRRKMRQSPLFRRAVTTGGERLGAVVGATVDAMSFQITSLTVSTGYWDDLVRGRLAIRRFTASPDGGEVIADTQIPIKEEEQDEKRHG